MNLFYAINLVIGVEFEFRLAGLGLVTTHTRLPKSTRSIDRLKREKERKWKKKRVFVRTRKNNSLGISCVCNFLSNVHFFLIIY